MSTEIVMTKTTMEAIRERMLALGFTEHSEDETNQYFDKRVVAKAVWKYARQITDLGWDFFDETSEVLIDIVPSSGTVQLYVPDLDYVDEFLIGSTEGEELLELAGAAEALAKA